MRLDSGLAGQSAELASSVSSASATAVAAPMQVTHVIAPARIAPCPCGSGRRYKHCCGQPSREPHASAAVREREQQIATVRHAVTLLQAGEAFAAEAALAPLHAEAMHDAGAALEAGEMYLEMHRLPAAATWLQRAAELNPASLPALTALQESRDLLTRTAAWRDASHSVRVQLAQCNAPPPIGAVDHVHIVCRLDGIGGTERRALNLYRQLSAHVRVTLWSTLPPLAAYAAECEIRCINERDFPTGGTLALIGTYFDCASWLETQAFQRVVICHNLAEHHASVAEKLRRIATNPARPHVRLTFPSQLFRDAAGLPGRIEYSAVDTQAFRRSHPRPAHAALTIGRHCRATPVKFHPNDPALFRAMLARGHSVRLLGGTAIARAFAHERGARPQLLASGALDAKTFLEDLDVFVYRKHPRLFETGGTAILEAMAMELPLIVFADDCGCAEVIEHGRNGLLATSEAEALESIDRLSRDPALRMALGCAARETVVSIMHRQRAALVESYAGSRLPVAAAAALA